MSSSSSKVHVTGGHLLDQSAPLNRVESNGKVYGHGTLEKRRAAVAYLITVGEKAKYIYEVNAEDPLEPATVLLEWATEFDEKRKIETDAKIRYLRIQLLSKEGFTVLKQGRNNGVREVSIKLKHKGDDIYISWKSKWPLAKSHFSIRDLKSVTKLETDTSNHVSVDPDTLGKLDYSKFSSVRLVNSSRHIDFLFESLDDVEVCATFFRAYIKPES